MITPSLTTATMRSSISTWAWTPGDSKIVALSNQVARDLIILTPVSGNAAFQQGIHPAAEAAQPGHLNL